MLIDMIYKYYVVPNFIPISNATYQTNLITDKDHLVAFCTCVPDIASEESLVSSVNFDILEAVLCHLHG